MTKSEFAILIPHFNQPEELDGALKSCCEAMSCENAHLVVVDDASSPGTRANIAVDKWAHRFAKVTVILNEENLGISKSLNRGLDNITEEFFFRLDSDDRALPSRFEEQLSWLKKGYDLVFSEALIRYEGNVISQTFSPSLSVIRRALPFQNLLIHPTLAARTDFFRQRGGYPDATRTAQYWAFWKLHLKDANAIVLREPLIQLGFSLNSASNARFKRSKNYASTLKLRTALRHADRRSALKAARELGLLYYFAVLAMPNPYRIRLRLRLLMFELMKTNARQARNS